mgnify:CR=1 FL=1
MSIEDFKTLMDEFDPASLLPELDTVIGKIAFIARIAVLVGPIVLLVNKDDVFRVQAGRSIATMLTECGLTVIMSELDSNAYRRALRYGNFDLYLGQTKLSPNMDLTAFFAEGGSLNYGAITDVAAYAMCLKALENSGNYQSLHKLVMQDGRVCPILVRSDAVYGRRGCFPGLSPSRDHIFYYSLGKNMEEARITE